MSGSFSSAWVIARFGTIAGGLCSFLRVSPSSEKKELLESRHRIAFTANESLVAKLERIKDLIGTASLEQAIERAADVLLELKDPGRRAAGRLKRQDKTQSA